MLQYSALDQFGFLLIEGADAVPFLQGYSTCDLEQLSTTSHTVPTPSRIGATCNIQGRMVSSYRVAAVKNGLILRMAAELVPVTMAFLKKYIVFSRASMTDMTGKLHCTGIFAEQDNLSILASPVNAESTNNLLVTTEAENSYELWCENRLALAPDSEEVSQAQWYLAEINAGIAWVTGATTEAFIPQMFDYQNKGGISFEKGCYLGQEIVARMQYRGELKRRLHRGVIDNGHMPMIGETILSDSDAHAGDVVAVASNGGQTVILAVVKEGVSHCQLANGTAIHFPA